MPQNTSARGRTSTATATNNSNSIPPRDSAGTVNNPFQTASTRAPAKPAVDTSASSSSTSPDNDPFLQSPVDDSNLHCSHDSTRPETAVNGHDLVPPTTSSSSNSNGAGSTPQDARLSPHDDNYVDYTHPSNNEYLTYENDTPNDDRYLAGSWDDLEEAYHRVGNMAREARSTPNDDSPVDYTHPSNNEYLRNENDTQSDDGYPAGTWDELLEVYHRAWEHVTLRRLHYEELDRRMTRYYRRHLQRAFRD